MSKRKYNMVRNANEIKRCITNMACHVALAEIKLHEELEDCGGTKCGECMCDAMLNVFQKKYALEAASAMFDWLCGRTDDQPLVTMGLIKNDREG